jgi:hypothetical protein
MRFPNQFFFPLLAFALVAGCSSSAEDLQTQLARARAKADASQEFRSMAKLLRSSNIQWSNQRSVRYTDRLGNVRTDKWEAADLSTAIFEATTAFMGKEQVSAIFVAAQQVNFLVGAAGLAPSGTAVGVIVPVGVDPQCSVVRSVDINTRGFQCEPAGEGMYVYLQR